jgi:nucleoside-diphosphate-sugar epimerase
MLSTIIQPAVFGTQNALEAAVKCGVKRFVHISSVAAVSPGDGGKSGRGTNAERAALTEDDWFEGVRDEEESFSCVV